MHKINHTHASILIMVWSSERVYDLVIFIFQHNAVPKHLKKETGPFI